MSDNELTLDDALKAADILRDMLDDEQDENKRLKERIKELELLLMENDIFIPDYEKWHGPFPMAE